MSRPGTNQLARSWRSRRGKKGGEVTVESRGYAAAAGRYALEIVGSSKSIEVVERPG
jgi:hypothetical protein